MYSDSAVAGVPCIAAVALLAAVAARLGRTDFAQEAEQVHLQNFGAGQRWEAARRSFEEGLGVAAALS